MALGNYDPTQVIILLAGVIPVEYVAEGTFISITKDSPIFTTSTSTDGQTYRTKIADTTYSVDLTLSSFSETNAILQGLMLSDQLSSISTTFPLLVKDTSGSSFYYAVDCWVEKQPNMSFGNSDTNRSWSIKCSGASVFYGDNMHNPTAQDEALALLISSLPFLKGILK